MFQENTGENTMKRSALRYYERFDRTDADMAEREQQYDELFDAVSEETRAYMTMGLTNLVTHRNSLGRGLTERQGKALYVSFFKVLFASPEWQWRVMEEAREWRSLLDKK
jgi:hypothetical protein